MTPTPRIPWREEAAIVQRARDGDRGAQARLLTSVLRLVRRDARHWAGDLDDLVQEGLMGVLHSIRRYDPARGRWITYAGVWWREWIRRASHRALAQGRSGVHGIVRARRYELRQALTDLELHHDGDVSAELAAKTGVRLDIAAGYIALQTRVLSTSLPAPGLDDGEGSQWIDSFAGHGPTPEDDVSVAEEARELRACVDGLPSILGDVIRWRYLTSPPLTHDAIGQRIHRTRQRSCQLESQALALLRLRCQATAGTMGGRILTFCAATSSGTVSVGLDVFDFTSTCFHARQRPRFPAPGEKVMVTLRAGAVLVIHAD